MYWWIDLYNSVSLLLLWIASRKKLLKQMTPTSSIILLEPMESRLTRFLSSFPDLSELFSPPMVRCVTVTVMERSWDQSQRSRRANFPSLLLRVNSYQQFLILHSMAWEWFHSSAALRDSVCRRATEMLSTRWSAPAEVGIIRHGSHPQTFPTGRTFCTSMKGSYCPDKRWMYNTPAGPRPRPSVRQLSRGFTWENWWKLNEYMFHF